MRCKACGRKTMGHTGFCQSCKSKRFHAHKRIEREGLIVDRAGGVWWVWDQKGEVLIIGKPTRDEAITALALGDEVDEEEDDEELEEGRRKAIDVAIQKAIDHPRCPDCGNTDVTTGRGPEDLACPRCGQQWEPSHADSMAYLRRITSTSNPFGELSPGETIGALVTGTAVLVGLTLIALRVLAPAPVATLPLASQE